MGLGTEFGGLVDWCGMGGGGGGRQLKLGAGGCIELRGGIIWI